MKKYTSPWSKEDTDFLLDTISSLPEGGSKASAFKKVASVLNRTPGAVMAKFYHFQRRGYTFVDSKVGESVTGELVYNGEDRKEVRIISLVIKDDARVKITSNGIKIDGDFEVTI